MLCKNGQREEYCLVENVRNRGHGKKREKIKREI